MSDRPSARRTPRPARRENRPSGQRPALRRVLVAVAVAALLLVGVPAAQGNVLGFYLGDKTPPRPVTAPQLPGDGGQLIAAVGDLACAPDNPVLKGGFGTAAGCQSGAVGSLLDGQRLAAFLPLGDEQYQTGSLADFQAMYDQHFGRFKAVTRPVPGNHEYMTANGEGYFSYFGAVAHQGNPFGPRAAGDYSYDVGSWHLVAINSNLCAPVSPCTPDSPTMKWLTADLAAHPAACTLAYWHHPIWSVGEHGSYAPMIPVWNLLQASGVDVVLVSHDHNYQRYAPIGPATALDAYTPAPPTIDEKQGMPMFIVGTGGANNYGFNDHPDPGVADALRSSSSNPATATFGVLFMRLGEGAYSYRFAQADTPMHVPFEDAGSGTCH